MGLADGKNSISSGNFRMTLLLASVANLHEAQLVASCGVGIIDLKNPVHGALGAWPVSEVKAAVTALNRQHALSATVGDLPMVAEPLVAAVDAMAATGVDYVKLGFFPGGDWVGVISALQPIAQRGAQLVAVLFADHELDCLQWIPQLAEAGFTGTMLDTADKQKGTLTQLRDTAFLRQFVSEVKNTGMLCGLAGSLRAEDVDPLLALGPDYLGFRGALCGGRRTQALEPAAVNSLLHILSNTSGQPFKLPPAESHHALQPHSPRPVPA